MAFAFVESHEFAGSGASVDQNYRGDAAAPAAGSMLVVYAIATAATPTPVGYTAIGAPKVVTDVSGTLYHTVFFKIADGSETHVHLAWSGSENYTGNVRYYTDPPVATLYEILSVLSTDGGNNTVTQDADALADGQPYLVFWGGDFGGSHWYSGGSSYGGATFANFSGTSFFGSSTGLASADDLASGQVATDRFGVGFGSLFGSPVDPTHCAGYFLAFGEGSPSVAGEADGGLLLGSAAPTVTNLEVEGASAGGLLLGSAEATIDGGFDRGASSGGLVLGSARGAVRLPHPVPGPPDRTDLLECGIYDAMVFTRGLGEIVGRLPFGQIDWGRVLDGVSTAGLTVDGVANRSQLQRCCALLGDVEPFEHELGIYRNGYRVWSGPITSMTFPPNQIAISAFDLSGWLQLRTLHTDYNAVQEDLINIWINYVEDAMAVDNSAGLHPTALALSGILADRLTQIVEHNIALDAIGELERTGIDWTTVDRVMQAGPVLTQPPAITDAQEFPLLIDSSFRVAPTIMLDGLQGANCWFVQGSGAAAGGLIFGEYGPAFPATPDHVAQPAAPDYAAIEAQYGRIEKNVSETRALDQPSIDDNARSRYDLTKRPVAVISEGLLLPSAPIAMRKLIPGSLVQIHLAGACKPIGDFYRIKSVKVSAHGDGSEDVNVEFQPLGTGTVLA